MDEQLTATPALPLLEPYTREQLLELFGRILPAHYLAPLQEPGPGYEVLQAYAAIYARVSEAIANIGNGNYIATADSGSYSTGQVAFYRDTYLWGGFTLEAGTIVGTASGYQYETLEPVTFGAQDTSVYVVPVQALVRGWLYNQPGPVQLESGEWLWGNVDRLIRPKLPDGGNFDPTVKVRQWTAIENGSSPMLDGLGFDRGLPRYPGESDDEYRLRLMLVMQTVTPEALLGVIHDLLTRYGLKYWVFEGWDLRVQTAWDMPINQVLTEAAPNVPSVPFNGNVFVYDYAPATFDLSSSVPGNWTNRLMSYEGVYRTLLISVPPLSSSLTDAQRGAIYEPLFQTLSQIRPAGMFLGFIER